MRPYLMIAWNSFRELLRQPTYLVVLTGTVALVYLLANVSYFGFGEEARLVKTTSLSLLLLSGLLNAVLNASATMASELRLGTALTLLAKPVGRGGFLISKFLGMAAASLVQVHVVLLAVLLASRMAFDPHGSPDWWVVGSGVAAVALAMAVAGVSNYVTRRPFHEDAVLAMVVLFTVMFVGINWVDREGRWQAFGAGLDWRLVPAGILVWQAVLVISGIALACSARLGFLPSLVICSGLFLAGLLSEPFFGSAARAGSWLGHLGYVVLPNWQVFWLADVLGGAGGIPWGYLGKAAIYAAVYLSLALTVALVLFEDRDLG